MVEIRRAALAALARILRTCDRRACTLGDARRVLICATGGIGNTLLLVPLLRILRRRLPHASIDLMLTSRAAADLAREALDADEVLCVREEAWYAGLGALRMFGWSIRSRRYDVVLRTFLTAPAMARASLGVYASGARVRVGFGVPRTNAFDTHIIELDEDLPEAQRHLALARALRLSVDDECGGLETPRRGREWAATHMTSAGWDGHQPLIGIHPGSDGAFASKRWSAQRFAEVTSLILRRLGARPLVIGGPDDADAVEQVVTAGSPGVLSARGQDIIQTSGLISLCSAFLSNDSGLMHLASQLGVPTLALFGPTDPVKNRPLGPRTEILRLGLECSPCNRLMATSLCPHHDCLETLSVERVFTALERLYDSNTKSASSASDRDGCPCAG